MRPAVLLVLTVLLIAGCGGDDDKGPSQEAFIARADAICAKADKAQTAVPARQPQGAYGNFSDAAFLTRYNAVTRKALAGLRALDAPDDNRKAFDELLSAIRSGVAAVDKRIAALRTRDLPGQSQALRDFQTSYGDVVAASGALGLSRCQGLGN